MESKSITNTTDVQFLTSLTKVRHQCESGMSRLTIQMPNQSSSCSSVKRIDSSTLSRDLVETMPGSISSVKEMPEKTTLENSRAKLLRLGGQRPELLTSIDSYELEASPLQNVYSPGSVTSMSPPLSSSPSSLVTAAATSSVNLNVPPLSERDILQLMTENSKASVHKAGTGITSDHETSQAVYVKFKTLTSPVKHEKSSAHRVTLKVNEVDKKRWKACSSTISKHTKSQKVCDQGKKITKRVNVTTTTSTSTYVQKTHKGRGRFDHKNRQSPPPPPPPLVPPPVPKELTVEKHLLNEQLPWSHPLPINHEQKQGLSTGNNQSSASIVVPNHGQLDYNTLNSRGYCPPGYYSQCSYQQLMNSSHFSPPSTSSTPQCLSVPHYPSHEFTSSWNPASAGHCFGSQPSYLLQGNNPFSQSSLCNVSGSQGPVAYANPQWQPHQQNSEVAPHNQSVHGNYGTTTQMKTSALDPRLKQGRRHFEEQNNKWNAEVHQSTLTAPQPFTREHLAESSTPSPKENTSSSCSERVSEQRYPSAVPNTRLCQKNEESPDVQFITQKFRNAKDSVIVYNTHSRNTNPCKFRNVSERLPRQDSDKTVAQCGVIKSTPTKSSEQQKSNKVVDKMCSNPSCQDNDVINNGKSATSNDPNCGGIPSNMKNVSCIISAPEDKVGHNHEEKSEVIPGSASNVQNLDKYWKKLIKKEKTETCRNKADKEYKVTPKKQDGKLNDKPQTPVLKLGKTDDKSPSKRNLNKNGKLQPVKKNRSQSCPNTERKTVFDPESDCRLVSNTGQGTTSVFEAARSYKSKKVKHECSDAAALKEAKNNEPIHTLNDATTIEIWQCTDSLQNADNCSPGTTTTVDTSAGSTTISCSNGRAGQRNDVSDQVNIGKKLAMRIPKHSQENAAAPDCKKTKKIKTENKLGKCNGNSENCDEDSLPVGKKMKKKAFSLKRKGSDGTQDEQLLNEIENKQPKLSHCPRSSVINISRKEKHRSETNRGTECRNPRGISKPSEETLEPKEILEDVAKKCVDGNSSLPQSPTAESREKASLEIEDKDELNTLNENKVQGKDHLELRRLQKDLRESLFGVEVLSVGGLRNCRKKNSALSVADTKSSGKLLLKLEKSKNKKKSPCMKKQRDDHSLTSMRGTVEVEGQWKVVKPKNVSRKSPKRINGASGKPQRDGEKQERLVEDGILPENEITVLSDVTMAETQSFEKRFTEGSSVPKLNKTSPKYREKGVKSVAQNLDDFIGSDCFTENRSMSSPSDALPSSSINPLFDFYICKSSSAPQKLELNERVPDLRIPLEDIQLLIDAVESRAQTSARKTTAILPPECAGNQVYIAVPYPANSMGHIYSLDDCEEQERDVTSTEGTVSRRLTSRDQSEEMVVTKNRKKRKTSKQATNVALNDRILTAGSEQNMASEADRKISSKQTKELERLHKDLHESFFGKDILRTTGYRKCRSDAKNCGENEEETSFEGHGGMVELGSAETSEGGNILAVNSKFAKNSHLQRKDYLTHPATGEKHAKDSYELRRLQKDLRESMFGAEVLSATGYRKCRTVTKHFDTAEKDTDSEESEGIHELSAEASSEDWGLALNDKLDASVPVQNATSDTDRKNSPKLANDNSLELRRLQKDLRESMFGAEVLSATGFRKCRADVKYCDNTENDVNAKDSGVTDELISKAASQGTNSLAVNTELVTAVPVQNEAYVMDEMNGNKHSKDSSLELRRLQKDLRETMFGAQVVSATGYRKCCAQTKSADQIKVPKRPKQRVPRGRKPKIQKRSGCNEIADQSSSNTTAENSSVRAVDKILDSTLKRDDSIATDSELQDTSPNSMSKAKLGLSAVRMGGVTMAKTGSAAEARGKIKYRKNKTDRLLKKGTSPKANYACKYCGAHFPKSKDAKTHIKEYHPESAKSKSKSVAVSKAILDSYMSSIDTVCGIEGAKTTEDTANREEEDSHLCKHCGKVFPLLSDVRTHVAHEHPGKHVDDFVAKSLKDTGVTKKKKLFFRKLFPFTRQVACKSTSPFRRKSGNVGWSFYGCKTSALDLSKIKASFQFYERCVQTNVEALSKLIDLDPVVLVHDIKKQ